MEPIINPWWIYLAEKSQTLGEVFLIIGILICIAYALINLFNFMDCGEKAIPKYILVISIIMIFIGSLFPNQKTVLTMLTVSQLTPNNIKLVGDTVEGTIDYIIENIEELTDEKDD